MANQSLSLKALVLVALVKCMLCDQSITEPNDVIDDLMKMIVDSQVVQRDSLGQYPTYVQGTYGDFPDSQILRNTFKVFDSNPFVTMWVDTMLLESTRLPNGPLLDHNSMMNSLKAVAAFHDKNRPTGDGMLVFWPQSLDTSSGEWYSNPNIIHVVDGVRDVLDSVQLTLVRANMKKVWVDYLEPVQDLMKIIRISCNLPVDFDDSLVNVGLGSLLYTSNLPKELYTSWKEANNNFSLIFKALKQNAYRPFSAGYASLMGPRSYFLIRKYLNSIDPQYPAAYFTAFARDSLSTQALSLDLTVMANVIVGITSCVLAQMETADDWFDEDMQVIYENTTALITWLVERNFTGRPDLAMPFYPSKFNFYWFLSRTYHLLVAYCNKSHLPLPYPVLNRVMASFSSILRETVTRDLLKQATTNHEGLVYYQAFLGKDDRTSSGEKVVHKDDCLCSTAMAVNTLLYTWTDGDRLSPDFPFQVKRVVVGASKWLMKYAKQMPAKCAIFSWPVHDVENLPIYYPYNYAILMNGTVVREVDAHLVPKAVMAVKSIIPEEEYEKDLLRKHFGGRTPLDFMGYNKGLYPIWTSDSITYASVVLALTQYKHLLVSGQL